MAGGGVPTSAGLVPARLEDSAVGSSADTAASGTAYPPGAVTDDTKTRAHFYSLVVYARSRLLQVIVVVAPLSMLAFHWQLSDFNSRSWKAHFLV